MRSPRPPREFFSRIAASWVSLNRQPWPRRALRGRRSGNEGFALGKQARFDGGERIADFVGHARGEHTQRRQLLLPLNDGVALDQLQAQGHDHFPIHDGGERHHENEQDQERAENEAAQKSE